MKFVSMKVRPFVYVASGICLFVSPAGLIFAGCGLGYTQAPYGQPILAVLPPILVLVGVVFGCAWLVHRACRGAERKPEKEFAAFLPPTAAESTEEKAAELVA